jgi:putative effector of murein hydrolase LrgA (UPF0299 family)
MIRALSILLGYQLVGEIIVRLLSWPIPGPVMGMLLLFGTLLVRGSVSHEVRATTQTLLGHLALLFVPAGVGIIPHVALLRDELLPITVTLVLSAYVTLLVTGLTLAGLLRLSRRLIPQQS